jgi:Protein of unknown function (DUF1403)
MIRLVPKTEKQACPEPTHGFDPGAYRRSRGAIEGQGDGFRPEPPDGDGASLPDTPGARRKQPGAGKASARARSSATRLAWPAFPSWARIGQSRRIGERAARGRSDGRGTQEAVELEAEKSALVVDAAFSAGAALAALDPLVRNEAAPFRGCFIARLSLKAAAASARFFGRAEDEPALRDAFCLRPGGGDPGPAAAS